MERVVNNISTESEKMYKYCVTNGQNINTADECYTPPAVYDAVLDYTVERYNLRGKHVVRPFLPGGDFKKYVYGKNDVVIDNPPFSITTKIVKWYIANNIPFFLFINGLYGVSLSRGLHGKATVIVTNANVSFYNKGIEKRIKLGFVTNMEPNNIVIRGDATLTNKLNGLVNKKSFKRFRYPDNFLKNSDILSALQRNVELKLTTDNCLFEDNLDYHKAQTRDKAQRLSVFGGGYLVNDQLYAEFKESLKQDLPRTYCVTLSTREQKIIEDLNKKTGDVK